jgi:lipooligosaccharide transport system permease protein
MLATPIGVRDILVGHIGYVGAQLAGASAIFMAVSAAFGAFSSWWVLLCLPVTVLVGLAFTVPNFAFSATQESDGGFNILFRFVITPLFLFSGTFFPIEQLPPVLRPVAWLTPLWHGVDANRELALGSPDLVRVALHVLVLLAFVAAGGWLALRAFHRRLVV